MHAWEGSGDAEGKAVGMLSRSGSQGRDGNPGSLETEVPSGPGDEPWHARKWKGEVVTSSDKKGHVTRTNIE